MAQTLTIRLPSLPREVRVVDEAATQGAPAAPATSPGAAAANPVERERKALSQAAAAFCEGARQFSRLREGMMKEAENQLLDLAVTIARKVMMQEIQAGRYEIDPIVKEALQRVPTRQGVVVRLNPVDLQKCRLAAESDGDCPDVQFVADPAVLPAHCLLETQQGVVESAVEPHLHEIGAALKNPE